MQRLAIVTLVVLAFSAERARAEDVVFARGGPASASAKQTVAAAIAALRGDMAPCWRRDATAADVAITTDAGGAVTSSAARTDGAVAQCVAGILAVATLPRGAGAWSGVVTIAPTGNGGVGGGGGSGGGGSGGSGGSGDDVGAILGKHAAALRACQKADAKAAGIVEIDLHVHPDGSITDVAVSRSLSAPLDACLVKALAALRLGEYHGKEVRYRLGLSYAGGGDDVPEPRVSSAGNGGGALAPTKRGPLSVDQMHPVVEADRAQIDRCGVGVKASGTLVVRFTIRKDGTVKNLGVKQTIGDAKVEACVLDRFAAMRFPAAGDETQVQFPLSFARSP